VEAAVIRFLDWIIALGKSQGLNTFNKIWMFVTAIMLILMVIGSYFKLGSERHPLADETQKVAPK
jgi:SNF family Na+-dependent transporter